MNSVHIHALSKTDTFILQPSSSYDNISSKEPEQFANFRIASGRIRRGYQPQNRLSHICFEITLSTLYKNSKKNETGTFKIGYISVLL